MDFSKAVDKVPHRRHNYKLDWYDIRGNTREWILDFLSGRSQRVVLEGASSDSEPVVSGVPQSTVLGPVLFLLCNTTGMGGLRSFSSHSTLTTFLGFDGSFIRYNVACVTVAQGIRSCCGSHSTD